MILSTRVGKNYPTPDSPTTYPAPETPDGSGDSTHASVIDLGAKWSGYRWWMVNTPYPSLGGAIHENPCIYGSNDRITWEVPTGLTNPIYPWSGIAGEYNNDCEIAWDDSRGRLVAYWREYKPGAGGLSWLASSSGDGVTWVHHGNRLPGQYMGMSPAIVKDPAGMWRAYAFGPHHVYLADDLLGPWTAGDPLINTVTPDAPMGGRHGDVIYHAGLWMAISAYDISGPPLAASLDGYTWHVGESANVIALGYRPTLELSTEDGYMDVWTSRNTTYYRMPISDWASLIP